MNIFSNIMQVLQLVSAVVMIGLILVQHGKGADAGAAFGSGGAGSASLFGASGSANFLSRSTAVLATLFLVSTLMLASLGGHQPASSGSVLESVAPAATVPVSEPAAPVTGAAQIPGK
ncbi:MAG: preprotein translocase subunit SecG [Polaromonas sp.]|nr:preprotein translocase subunit SecG [Polaromonas sp.]